MKKFALLCMVLIMVFPPAFSFGSFDDAVEDSRTAEKDNRSETKQRESQQSSRSRTNSSAEDDSAVLLIELLMYAWLYNFSVRYTPFPYSYDREKYLVYEKYFDFSSNDFYFKRRFALDTACLWLGDLGFGNETRFEGMLYPVIGLYAENQIFTNHSDAIHPMGNIQLGGQVPIIQTNPLSIYFLLCWTQWYGDVHDLLRDSTAQIGFDVKSYPFRPLTLRWTVTWQDFDNDVYIHNSNLQAGIMQRNREYFVAWKYLSVGNDATHNIADNWNGIVVGARLYF